MSLRLSATEHGLFHRTRQQRRRVRQPDRLQSVLRGRVRAEQEDGAAQQTVVPRLTPKKCWDACGARTRHAHARPEGVPEDDLTIWAMKPEELSAYDWTGEGMTVEIARAGILDKVESGPAVKADG